MSRVLVVEDDPATGSELVAALGFRGLEVKLVTTGEQGLLSAASEAFDAIVLDRMLPGRLDGLAVLSTLRAAGVDTPILILSALSELNERVRGLRAGGDDYLTKPFEFLELTARLESLMRRRGGQQQVKQTSLRIGDLEIDLLKRTVKRGAATIDLLPREYQILEFLAQHVGEVVTRTMMLEEVWGYRYDARTNVVDVHMSKLRKKIDGDSTAPMIQTVRGAGYMLHAPD